MASFTSTLAILLVLLVSGASARGCGKADWIAARRRMIQKVRASANPKIWPGRLLRAGFHDCLPKSCDGSLQFELDRQENRGIAPTVDFLREVRGDSCVAMSDMLKIGMIVSMQLSGGVRFRCPLGNRADATEANPTSQIPSVREDADTILRKFTTKGFTTREALAGNFGGHSLGFSRGGTRPFTSRVDRYGKDFAQYVVGLPRSERLPRFAAFNHLPSDVSLVKAQRRAVQRFASSRKQLDAQFTKFMTKLCKL